MRWDSAHTNPILLIAATAFRCSPASFISTVSQLHAAATTTIRASNDRMLNWNRHRKIKAPASHRNIASITVAMAAMAIKTGQPLGSQRKRFDTHNRNSTSKSPITKRPGVRWNQRTRTCRVSAMPAIIP
jgi:hypothetical protein